MEATQQQRQAARGGLAEISTALANAQAGLQNNVDAVRGAVVGRVQQCR